MLADAASPETRNKTWAEIDEMYNNGIPCWRMSGEYCESVALSFSARQLIEQPIRELPWNVYLRSPAISGTGRSSRLVSRSLEGYDLRWAVQEYRVCTEDRSGWRIAGLAEYGNQWIAHASNVFPITEADGGDYVVAGMRRGPSGYLRPAGPKTRL